MIEGKKIDGTRCALPMIRTYLAPRLLGGAPNTSQRTWLCLCCAPPQVSFFFCPCATTGDRSSNQNKTVAKNLSLSNQAQYGLRPYSQQYDGVPYLWSVSGFFFRHKNSGIDFFSGEKKLQHKKG